MIPSGVSEQRRTPAAIAQGLIAVIALLALLAYLDWQVTENRTIGNERNAVLGALERTRDPKPSGLVLLGSSTTADWLPQGFLASTFGEPREEVVRAHINGGHQTCSLAEARHLLAQGRHFRVAIFGTNQFQMCEYPHSKRVLQHQMLMPAADLPLLMGLYAKTAQPLQYYGRFVGGLASGAYAETATLQRTWARAIFGDKHNRAPERWVHRTRRRSNKAATEICPYEPSDVRYKSAAQDALLSSLERLADEVFLLVLPEATLSDDSPAARRAWRRHLQNMTAMADAHARVHLIDLTSSGARDPEDFTDGFHVQRKLHTRQRRFFRSALAPYGYPRPRRAR